MKKPKDPIQAKLEFYDALERGDFSPGQTVARMRRLIGMNQTQYSKLIGIAPRVLMDLERGVGNPTLETLEKIGKPFGLKVMFRQIRRG